MTLIKKNPGNRNKISNFLPITLLNVDLKILVKVLVKRLVLVAERLVEEAQTNSILFATL